MAKRRNTGMSVNLFPFLSVLVSIIGCLTMIIVVINISQMNKAEGKTPDEVVRANEYLKLKKDKEEDDAKRDEMRQLLKNLIQENKDTIAARDKLKMLKSMLENQEEVEASREELINQFNLLQQTNKQLDKNHENLLAEIKLKEEEIAKRKLPPVAAKLQVKPSGSGTATRPFFLEIGRQSVYIHESVSGEPVAIPKASLNQSPEFVGMLKTISSSRQNKLILLIRGEEQSMGTLNEVQKLVRAYNNSNGAEIVPGKLPLPSEGKVDLNMFAKFLKP